MANKSIKRQFVFPIKAMAATTAFVTVAFVGGVRCDAAQAKLFFSDTQSQAFESRTFGWQEIDGQTYYFQPGTGQKIFGRQEIDGKTYYFSPDTGAMALGWQEINGQTYHFDLETGEMAFDWQKIDGGTYYFEPNTGRLLTGWQEIEGKIYYFSPRTWELASGWQEIDGKTYYFDLKTGTMALGQKKIDGNTYYFERESGALELGWQKIGGKTYYFEPQTGKMSFGFKKIKNSKYYFSPKTGVMLTGWQDTPKGRRYFSKKNGEMATGWQALNGKKYYFSKDSGKLATGAKKINGRYYIFNSKGQLAKSGGVSLTAVGGGYYCADKNGIALSGWRVIGNRLYYASGTGKVKTNATYNGVTFGSKGAAVDNLNTKLKIKTMQILSSITNRNMTQSQKLSACWSYVVGGGFRYAAKYPNLGVSGWQRQTAYDMLTTHTGNCYSYACAFAALAKEIGYQPYVICGRVHGSRDRAADGLTRHAWVRINGLYYDPEAHYAGWRRGIYQNSGYPVSHTVQSVTAY